MRRPLRPPSGRAGGAPGSVQQDQVEADRVLAIGVSAVVRPAAPRPVPAGLGADPEPVRRLPDQAERDLVEGRGEPGPDAVVVTEDLAPPDAGPLLGELVEEPVAEAVP